MGPVPNPRQIYPAHHEQQPEAAPAPEPPDHVQRAFESGLQQGMQISASQQRQFAHQQALMLAGQAEARIATVRRESFDQGYMLGVKAGRAEAPAAASKPGATYTYSDVEAARARGYQEGRAARSAAVPNESAIRKKLIDEMVEQCRVISESNPNMAPGVNAVRHRIKKLG